MQLFRFDGDVGRRIDEFGSQHAVLSPIGRLNGVVSIACFHLQAGGIIGHHPAAMRQLFLVVQGQGRVRGADDQWVAIRAGQAAFWEHGELHETATELGLTAIVIEGKGLNPEAYMQPLSIGNADA